MLIFSLILLPSDASSLFLIVRTVAPKTALLLLSQVAVTKLQTNHNKSCIYLAQVEQEDFEIESHRSGTTGCGGDGLE